MASSNDAPNTPTPNPQNDSPRPRAVNTEGAAAYLGDLFSPATLATMRCRGGGPPFRKVGRRVFYLTTELDEYLMKHPPVRSTAELRAQQEGRS